MIDSYYEIEGIKSLLFNSGNYYMICIGLDSNISYVNKRYADHFSFIEVDLVGKPYNLTMHPDDLEVCKEVGAKCFEFPNESFSATVRKHKEDGGYVITLWDYRLIHKNGIPEGIFCIGHDITELEAKRKDIETLNQSLDKSNQILEKVAFDQSHVVRAPLANILGLVGILKNMKLGTNVNNIVSMLQESSDKLDTVIRETIKSTYS